MQIKRTYSIPIFWLNQLWMQFYVLQQDSNVFCAVLIL